MIKRKDPLLRRRMTMVISIFFLDIIHTSYSFTSSITTSRRLFISDSNSRLFQYPPRQNIQISSQDSYSTPDEETYTGEWTSAERDFLNENKQKRQYIEKVLEEDEKNYRLKKRRERLGKYANVTTASEFATLEKIETQEREWEHNRTIELAKSVGVTLQSIPPRPPASSTDGEGRALTLSTEAREKAKSLGWDGGGVVDLDLEDDDGELDLEPSVKNGKIVTKAENVEGIKVGSAGGWSLEVFPGDFVVHRKYGIGRFDGTTTKAKNLNDEERKARDRRRLARLQRARKRGASEKQLANLKSKFGTDVDTDPVSNPQMSVLVVVYADATVHVPVERAYRLSRYRAGDAVIKPRLSRIKGETWAKTTSKVMASTAQLAQDVLALYATREMLTRAPFNPSLEGVVKDFGETFPFEPTPDQKSCFEAVENDMVWRKRPMDRLICGDVGFGKTEVAVRALYRCAVNGRQAALLAPTGVLAAQHYKNIMARMEPFNITVSMLRGGMGKNTKAGRILREDISNGKVNMIIGTHALLSHSLQFKDLGLLVVDEEQRFGVKQKERLKLICNGVDVLTLSATPIPRTLQMSLSGIRDTSTLRSPPPMRKATVTHVEEYNAEIVHKAIKEELERGGQCYYVCPRISMLEDASKTIKGLFPDIRIITAHGRMAKQGAEENVADFAEGKADVLLATTVIENGVDIPTVNTIIIQNAQMFGMSTLYQLRGRVGRSSTRAKCYFLHKDDILTEQSAARLQTMADLQKLGSGFDVASRDLEIRGAGSLLGTEQSGMAARVGFDLYMRMLKKSVRQLRGLDLGGVVRTNVLLPEGNIEGQGNMFVISPKYIQDNVVRKKQETAARLAENTETLVALTKQWKDDFGPLPTALQNKLKSLHLHACTRQLGIDLVGLIETTTEDGQVRHDGVLRAPGLRPRHWATICQSLPRHISPKGVNVIFPDRFTPSAEDLIIEGGTKCNVNSLLPKTSKNLLEDDEDEEWDALDQEEVEAMKEISSAVDVVTIDQVDLQQYPRLVIPNLGELKGNARIAAILKALLPAVKVVSQRQKEDKERAQLAAELRDRREAMRKRKKQEELMEKKKNGYYY